jgi:predicted DNA-binding ribbon-helix-helix protein
MAHVHYILDTQGYKYALRIRNIYWFSTARIVARRRLIVTRHALLVNITLRRGRATNLAVENQ